MRNFLIILWAGLILLSVSCSKDLGNYDYIEPEKPVVANLDSIYRVYVGDRLVVNPTVTFSKMENLSYEWKISIPGEMREDYYEGATLDIFFGLETQRYSARFTVVDNNNGMKYFYPFTIIGQAAFSEGIALLTSNGGKAEISFIKPDGTVQSNLYEQMYGEPLPDGPLQLITLQHQYMTSFPYLGYWIICSDKNNPGVELDVNTFQRIKYFRENFFDEPEGEINAQYFLSLPVGTMNGVINNKLYVGASSTYYISPVYGFFGTPVLGDYQLAPQIIYSGGYYIGYDLSKGRLVYFDGGANYYGDDYTVSGSAFNPKQLNISVYTMQMVNMDVHYLIGKDQSDSKIYEFRFGISLSPRAVSAVQKRAFIRQDLVNENTKWVLTGTEVFYFTSGSQVYRYNPLNEDIRTLGTDFEGKNVTMLKLAENGGTLIAGTEGNLYFLDISTGKNGEILRKITGIQGEPVDLYVREE
jgi:hypothetical protein